MPYYPPLSKNLIDVHEFGATGDGATDDTVALQAALDAYVPLYFPSGVYLTSAPLVSAVDSQILVGEGGHSSSAFTTSTIKGGHTSGAVLQFKNRSPRLEGLRIDATATRRAAGNPLAAGGTVTGHGILMGGDDTAPNAAVIISRQYLRDVWITNQPTDGIHSRYGCELSEYHEVTAQDCVRHGFLFDDGTGSGATNKGNNPFHWGLWGVRAFECGGQGLVIGFSGQTLAPIDLYTYNLQMLGCAFDSNKRISDYLCVSYGSGVIFDHPDFEDQQYAATLTVLANTRTGRATPTKGIHVNSSRHEFRHPYFSSLIQSIEFAGSTLDHVVTSPRILAGTYAIAQAHAFFIPSTGTGFKGRASTSLTAGATQIFRNQCTEVDIRVDGKVNIGTAATASDIVITQGETATVAAIVSGTSSEPDSNIFQMDAQSDTAPVDSLSRMTRVGFVSGQILRMRAKTGETITVNNGVANSGSNYGFDLNAPTRILSGTTELWVVFDAFAAAPRWKEINYYTATSSASGRLTNSATYNPPSLLTGVRDTEQSMTITGVALGDMVVGASFSVDLAGCRLEAYVSGTDTVKYQFYNPTVGTVDLASGTVRITVQKI